LCTRTTASPATKARTPETSTRAGSCETASTSANIEPRLMSNAAASAIRDGPIRPAIVFEFAMDCLPARCRCGTSTDKNTHREKPVRRRQQPVRHRPSAVGNEPKRNARRPCMITQRLGAEDGDTPVEQQPAAMQDFDPTYDRCGSFFTLDPPSTRLLSVWCGRQCDETAPTLRAKAALGGQLSAPPLRRRLRTVPNTAG